MDAALFLADLERKPQTLRAAADALATGGFRWPLPRPTERVLLIGMGSSLFAAEVAAQRLRGAGVNAVAESGSVERSWRVGPHDLVAGITAGGRSVETNRLFGACAGGHRVAVTNTPGSDITADVEHVVLMRADNEAGGVACRSYTHTLVALLALEQQLVASSFDLPAAVRAAADATEDLLARRADWLPPACDLLAGPHGSWLLAPAERISSARQGALMMRECPRRPSVGCETGEWSHIDVYLTKTLDYRALLFAGSRWDAPALAWLGERRSRVLGVGGEVPGAALTVRYPGDDDALVALLTESLVPELIAAALWAAS